MIQASGAIPTEKGVIIPDKLSAKDTATKFRLETLSGKAFDRAYMRDMVADHAEDVSEFRTESKTAQVPDVKTSASQTLPTLESHLERREECGSKTG